MHGGCTDIPVQLRSGSHGKAAWDRGVSTCPVGFPGVCTLSWLTQRHDFIAYPCLQGPGPGSGKFTLSFHTAIFFSQPKDTIVLHQLPQGAWVYLIHETNPISEIKTQAKAFHQISPRVGFSPLLPTPRSSPDGLSSSRLSSGRFIQLCQESLTPSSVPLSWQDYQKR